jgi:hypothetical protein
MRAYKFLAAGRRAPFSGFAWPEREWVEADALDPCRSGIHACRPEHLAYWIMEELWAVELDGDLVESELKVVARRGRLVERIGAWNDEAKREFREEAIRWTARYAMLELREVDLAAEADSLEHATLAELGERAGTVADAAADAGEGDAADLCRYVVDAAAYAAAGHTVGPAFVAAHAADVYAPVDVDDPFAAERASQGVWLAERLRLSEAEA